MLKGTEESCENINPTLVGNEKVDWIPDIK